MENTFEKKAHKSKIMLYVALLAPFAMFIANLISSYMLNDLNLSSNPFDLLDNGTLFFTKVISAAALVCIVLLNVVGGLNTKKSLANKENWLINHFENKLDSFWARTALIPALGILSLWVLSMVGAYTLIQSKLAPLEISEICGLLLKPAFLPIVTAFFVYAIVANATAADVEKDEMEKVGLFDGLEELRNYPKVVGTFNALSLIVLWTFAGSVIGEEIIKTSFYHDSWFNGMMLLVLIMGSITAVISIHDIYFRSTLLTLGLVAIAHKVSLTWILADIGGDDIIGNGEWFSVDHMFYYTMGHMLSFAILFGCITWIVKAAYRYNHQPVISVWQFLFATIIIVLQNNISVSSIRNWQQLPHMDRVGYSTATLNSNEIDEVVFDVTEFQFKRLFQRNQADALGITENESHVIIHDELNKLGYAVTMDEVVAFRATSPMIYLATLKTAYLDNIGYTKTDVHTRKNRDPEDENLKYVSSLQTSLVIGAIVSADNETFLKAIGAVHDALGHAKSDNSFEDDYINAYEKIVNMIKALHLNDKNHFWDLYFEDINLVKEVYEINSLGYRVSLIEGWAPDAKRGEIVIPRSIEINNKRNITFGKHEIPVQVLERALDQANAAMIAKYSEPLRKLLEADMKKSKDCGLNPFNC